MPAPEDKLFVIDQHFQARIFEAQIGTRQGKQVVAFVLVECEVDDPQRFAFNGGTWWKIEQPQ
ncbi:MAG: hypothetical protein C0456_18965 [Hyphomonas sp.]|uniref:hypothetical protein n=1 Tax=Hyphomonas sp. TaxID=87 RepID=UPI001D9E1074|nr:hypothetical protein [Hyphomonas sp.]MBA4228690.1 hypothetical protein [Hyphomonas sp.]